MPSSHRQRSPYTRLLSALAIIMPVLSVAGHAEEAGICVHCTEPEASYLCQIAGPSNQNQVYDARLQLLCIKTLAKQNQHGQCSVERTSSGPCTGETVSIEVPGNQPDGPLQDIAEPEQPAIDTFADSEQGTGTETEPPPADNTSQQSDNIIKSAGKAMSKAGKTIGDTAKKSWDCVTSLFNDC